MSSTARQIILESSNLDFGIYIKTSALRYDFLLSLV